MDAIVHVVRCFDDENVTHVSGKVGPADDIETINLELVFADMETVEKRLSKAQSNAKGGDKKYLVEAELLSRIYKHLEGGKPVRTMELTDDETETVKTFFLDR